MSKDEEARYEATVYGECDEREDFRRRDKRQADGVSFPGKAPAPQGSGFVSFPGIAGTISNLKPNSGPVVKNTRIE